MKHLIQRERGFTLIELMIVVSIMAILVALAVPAYTDFTIRAKVAECVSDSAPAKTSISEYKQTMGIWPPTMLDAGLTDDPSNNLSEYCTQFFFNNMEGNGGRGSFGDFAIEVDMAALDSSVASLSLIMIMSPVLSSSGNVDWTCTRGWGDGEALKYMPASCRGDNIFQ